MAHLKHPEWPDAPKDRDEFYQDLREFMRERGVPMDTVPKVSTSPVDLHEFFLIVHENGGYDQVSAQKLQWRRLAERHWNLGGTNNAAAYAFQLKSLFYRNLAAYSIKRVYKQEPPPREILEDVTAKGGNLLSRTLEGWRKEQAARGKPVQPSDDSSSEPETSARGNRMSLDESATGGRTSRLRQAPPQRQFFQPDVSSTRQSRQVLHQIPSPQPMAATPTYQAPTPPMANINSASFQINSWEGRNLNAGIHVRPVPTPSNNVTTFKDRVRRIREARLAEYNRLPEPRGSIRPGDGFIGPNIFYRVLCALRSGIPKEQDYALHHLVKISYERGDNFRMSQYPGLADGLVNKGLEIASTFYDVKWSVCYDDELLPGDPWKLDGLNGTSDILERISRLTLLDAPDEPAPAEYRDQVSKATETALVIRNMCLLDENAQHLSEQTHLGDLLTIWLKLPVRDSLIEMKMYALETVEQLSYFWLREQVPAPLYSMLISSLEDALERGNRGVGLSVLRSLAHIGSLMGQESGIDGISVKTLKRVFDWTLIDDEEILSVCLDFFYRYFSRVENMAFFLEQCDAGNFYHHGYFKRIVQLMKFGARKINVMVRGLPPIAAKTAEEIATMPADLMSELAPLEEPQRSSAWLRCFFEEHADSDIKQIALWHAYQRTFKDTQVPLLPAADFIKNVSNTFTAAAAQVIQEVVPKFIIKGIRYRHVPVTQAGDTFHRCAWCVPVPRPDVVEPAASGPPASPRPAGPMRCGSFHRTPAQLWEHVLNEHVGLSRNDAGQWDLAALRSQLEKQEQKIICKWSKCRRFHDVGGTSDPFAFGQHLKTHMPDTGEVAAHRARYTRRKRPEPGEEVEQPMSWEAEADFVTFHDTPVDVRGQLAPIPVNCTLVLRMVARMVPAAAAQLAAREPAAGGGRPTREAYQWLQELFSGIWNDLWRVASYNRTLAGHVMDVISMAQRGMEDEEGEPRDII